MAPPEQSHDEVRGRAPTVQAGGQLRLPACKTRFPGHWLLLSRDSIDRMNIDQNTVVAVTGGTAGVGRAVAREFARAGARVAVVAREPGRLQETSDELSALGVQCLAIEADVANASQVEEAAARIERELGPIDIWVNNAMVTVVAPVAEMETADYQRVTDVTYLGTVWGTMAALRRMRRRNRGTIVQVGSALAYSLDPAAVRLLRSQARHSRIHGVAQDRAAARRQRGRGHAGGASGREHAPVRLVPHDHGSQPAAGGQGLPAGGDRPRHALAQPQPLGQHAPDTAPGGVAGAAGRGDERKRPAKLSG